MGVPSSKVLSFLAGLADCRGWLAEMYTYQAYGDAQIWLWPEGDINRDGTADSLDNQLVSAGVGEGLDPLLDKNLDGVVAAYQDWVYYQQTSEAYATTVGNPYLFTGRTTELVHTERRNSAYPTTSVRGTRRLQDNRNRMYDPKHGRWLQRDPAGVRLDPPKALVSTRDQYWDGMSLYQYVRSRPTVHMDSHGRQAEEWFVPLLSDWDLMAAGELDTCPPRLELPPPVDGVLADCVRRTHSTRPEVEWGGVLAYDANTRSKLNSVTPKYPNPGFLIRHRTYGPVIGGREPSNWVEPEVAAPLFLPSGEIVYGWYHSHTYKRESQLSPADIQRFLEGPSIARIPQKERYQIALMRDCECTKALVRLRTTPLWEDEKLRKDFAQTVWRVPVKDNGRVGGTDGWYEAMAEADRILAGFANRNNFCFYRGCGPTTKNLLKLVGGPTASTTSNPG